MSDLNFDRQIKKAYRKGVALIVLGIIGIVLSFRADLIYDFVKHNSVLLAITSTTIPILPLAAICAIIAGPCTIGEASDKKFYRSLIDDFWRENDDVAKLVLTILIQDVKAPLSSADSSTSSRVVTKVSRLRKTSSMPEVSHPHIELVQPATSAPISKKPIVTDENRPRSSTKSATPPHSTYRQHSPDVALLQNRGVKHLYHFTNIDNLSSILRHGILSVNKLRSNGIKYFYNDPNRHDGNPDAISISISFPNNKLFYKFRKAVDWQDRNRWVVLEMPVSILDELEYKCYAHNAARYDTPSCSIEEMFGNSNDEYPEDVQAEIMVEDSIPATAIKCIYVDYPYGPGVEVREIVSSLGLSIPVVKSHTFFKKR